MPVNALRSPVFGIACTFAEFTGHVVERWLSYRDNRNDTAHDYGEEFAETTLKLLPAFVEDAKALAILIVQSDDG